MAESRTPADSMDLSALAEMSDAEIDRFLIDQAMNSEILDDLDNAGQIDMSRFGEPWSPESVTGDVEDSPRPRPSPRRQSTPPPLSVLDDEPDLPTDTNDVVSESVTDDWGADSIADLASPGRGVAEDDSDYVDAEDFSDDMVPHGDEDEPEPTFAPSNPEIPDVDDSAAPEVVRENPVLGDVVPPEDNADSSNESGGKLGKAATSTKSAIGGALLVALLWVKKQPTSRKITAAVIAVILIIAMVIFLGGGSGAEDDSQSGGGAVVDDNAPAAEPGSEDPSGDVAPLTDVIDTMSGNCSDPTTAAPLAAAGAEDEAWVCGRPGETDGNILNIAFRRAVTVHSIAFTPGFNYVHEPAGDDEWERHRVISRVLVRVGGQQIPAEVVPSRETFELELDEPIRTNEGNEDNPPGMSITIQDSVPPNDGGDEEGGFFGGDGGGDDLQNAIAMQNLVISGTVN